MTIGEIFLGSVPLILGVALAVVIKKRDILRGIEWLVVSIIVVLGSLYLMKSLAPVLRPLSRGLFPGGPISHGGGWGWIVTNFISLFVENFASYGWPVMLVDVAVGVAVGWGVSVLFRK
jgi:hypothetical protein